jgi:hypothetical protein
VIEWMSEEQKKGGRAVVGRLVVSGIEGKKEKAQKTSN